MSLLKKIWHFIWEEDSLLSWIVNVILAIVIIKFLVYPGLGLLLGTNFPVVAVVSCSMEHGVTNCGENRAADICGDSNTKVENFDEYWKICGGWYEGINITKDGFKNFDFNNGFKKGDIMVLIGTENINIGDVIVFYASPYNAPIIHRVVKIDEDSLMTKGDHNSDQNGFEKNIKKDMVLGKAVFRIPYLGWFKVIFSEIIGG